MDAETKLKPMTPSIHDQSPLADDLIWGVKAIAAELDRTERQTYHLLTTGQLPAQLVGGRWVASRSGLRQRFAQVLGGAV
jgi:hypothetical protein